MVFAFFLRPSCGHESGDQPVMLHCRASPFMAWICVRKTAGILEPPFSVNQFFLQLVLVCCLCGVVIFLVRSVFFWQDAAKVLDQRRFGSTTDRRHEVQRLGGQARILQEVFGLAPDLCFCGAPLCLSRLSFGRHLVRKEARAR